MGAGDGFGPDKGSDGSDLLDYLLHHQGKFQIQIVKFRYIIL